jgi:hypothetical protein
MDVVISGPAVADVALMTLIAMKDDIDLADDGLARTAHGVRAGPLERLRSTGRGPGACGTAMPSLASA